MKKYFIYLAALSFLFSCQNNKQKADAYGNFEANETLVSSESSGKILRFFVEEGAELKLNQVVGLIDTILPVLQKVEIEAQSSKIRANLASMDAQIAVFEQQKINLLVDKKRIENMLASGASTQKQMDDINGGLDVIDKQIDAAKTQKIAIAKEYNVIEAKKMMLDEQLKKCRISNPVKGTVLEKYAEIGEVTGAGRPLYKIANTEELILRAYVSGGQLNQVKLGNTCKVLIDSGAKDFLNFEGKITWIASQAEFTPKIIQTKEERINMVYAVKILVKNDGSIKIGMPGEVYFQ
jgi:HlyD family secretion protein